MYALTALITTGSECSRFAQSFHVVQHTILLPPFVPNMVLFIEIFRPEKAVQPEEAADEETARFSLRHGQVGE
jgi:hypothetical protein